MQRYTPIVLFFLAAGCNYTPPDPCSPNSLFGPGLTPEEKANCLECENAHGCDAAETGGEVETADLTCEPRERGSFCYVGSFDLDGYTHKTAAECDQLSAAFDCHRTWGALTPYLATETGSLPPPMSPGIGGVQCVLCETNFEIVDDAEPKPPQATNEGWKLCAMGPIPASDTPKPAIMDAVPAGVEQWIDDLTCEEYLDPGFACPKGFIAIDRGFPLQEDLIWESYFTCECSTDADCQPGAVCEAGWTLEDVIPHPTLCTWDDGTSNGVAPEGPEVYGLTQWSDGIRIVRGRVTITGAMYLAMINGAALWNDDQRFALDGEITHCGPQSLCQHLGFAVGDTPLLTEADLAVLERGDVVTFAVLRADASTHTLSAVIDFDGF